MTFFFSEKLWLNFSSESTARQTVYLKCQASYSQKNNNTVNVLKLRSPKCLTKWHMQTVQIQLKEQSDHGLH